MKKSFVNKNKFIIFILCFVLNIVALNAVFATEVVGDSTEETVISNTSETIFDIKTKEGTYKLSEEDGKIYLPFIRYASDRIIVDKEVSNIGALFSAKSIEINEAMKNMQILFASDSVRINNEVELPVVFSGEDVVIDSHITGPAIIFSSGNITITENGIVDEDVICISNNLTIKGTVNGSVIGLISANLDISGVVNKDVRVHANNLITSGSENINGNVVVKTYNKDLNISNNYPNAIVRFLTQTENNNVNVLKRILNVVTECLVYTLIYMLFVKYLGKEKVKSLFEKIKEHPTFTVVSGSIVLLSMPLVLIILIVLIAVSLGLFSGALAILYFGYIVLCTMLSNFVVGSFTFTYIKDKYLKDNNLGYDIIGAFVSFATIYGLTFLPYVGGLLKTFIVIIANGIVFTLIFKKLNNKSVEEK